MTKAEKEPRFLKPKEIPKTAAKRSVGARINPETYEFLRLQAADAGLTFSQMLENVIETYADWLKKR